MDVEAGHGILAMLEHAVPFRFLNRQERQDLYNDLTECNYGPGDSIYRCGDRSDDVYLLDFGVVETIDSSVDPPFRVNRIDAGHYFGERASLFSQRREYSVVATEAARVFCMTGQRFLELVHASRAFAQSLGTILKEKQDVFAAFDRFSTEVSRGVGLGYLDIRRLIPVYQALDPALHPAANDGGEIDLAALRYAVRRLPENVTRTFVYLLTDDLPFEFSWPDDTFHAVPTAARRRNIWEMLPGKSMVLLRTGLSDLMDLITCLCLYAVEARKIRKRISEPETLLAIGSYLSSFDVNAAGEIPSTLPFSAEEREGLRSIWPLDAAVRLQQMAFHREAITVDIRRQTQSYNSRRTDIWTHQIGQATRELLGYDPSDIPPDVAVHIISSNTHSVTNCLNPFYVDRREDILRWARSTDHPDTRESWHNEQDLVYSLARSYIPQHPVCVDDAPPDRDWGMLRLSQTVSTGIQVELFDVSRLAGKRVDPALGEVPSGLKALIVNIDYAFGEQAGEIIRNLALLYGRNLGSINVLGKAGSLMGKRGDVLVPTAFIEQGSDRFYPLTGNFRSDLRRLSARVPDRGVYAGPLLTVGGTLLQNRMMLQFYRHIWGCIGLEMEGTHYFRQILESEQLGVLPERIPLRFLYYVSDLPLDRDSGLSAQLSSREGIPPLYAVTREILCDIFEGETAAS